MALPTIEIETYVLTSRYPCCIIGMPMLYIHSQEEKNLIGREGAMDLFMQKPKQ